MPRRRSTQTKGVVPMLARSRLRLAFAPIGARGRRRASGHRVGRHGLRHLHDPRRRVLRHLHAGPLRRHCSGNTGRLGDVAGNGQPHAADRYSRYHQWHGASGHIAPGCPSGPVHRWKCEAHQSSGRAAAPRPLRWTARSKTCPEAIRARIGSSKFVGDAHALSGVAIRDFAGPSPPPFGERYRSTSSEFFFF